MFLHQTSNFVIFLLTPCFHNLKKETWNPPQIFHRTRLLPAQGSSTTTCQAQPKNTDTVTRFAGSTKGVPCFQLAAAL